MIQIARDNDIIPILLTVPSSHRKGKELRYLTKRLGLLNDLSDLTHCISNMSKPFGTLLLNTKRS